MEPITFKVVIDFRGFLLFFLNLFQFLQRELHKISPNFSFNWWLELLYVRNPQHWIETEIFLFFFSIKLVNTLKYSRQKKNERLLLFFFLLFSGNKFNLRHLLRKCNWITRKRCGKKIIRIVHHTHGAQTIHTTGMVDFFRLKYTQKLYTRREGKKKNIYINETYICVSHEATLLTKSPYNFLEWSYTHYQASETCVRSTGTRAKDKKTQGEISSKKPTEFMYGISLCKSAVTFSCAVYNIYTKPLNTDTEGVV